MHSTFDETSVAVTSAKTLAKAAGPSDVRFRKKGHRIREYSPKLIGYYATPANAERDPDKSTKTLLPRPGEAVQNRPRNNHHPPFRLRTTKTRNQISKNPFRLRTARTLDQISKTLNAHLTCRLTYSVSIRVGNGNMRSLMSILYILPGAITAAELGHQQPQWPLCMTQRPNAEKTNPHPGGVFPQHLALLCALA